MAQHGFSMGGGHGGGSIDPNDLGISGNFQNSFHNNYSGQNNSNAFATGSALFGDDELLDGLSSPTDTHQGMSGNDFQTMGSMPVGFNQQGMYNNQHPTLQINPAHGNFSSTPDGDPIQSPYVHGHGFGGQYRQMQHPSLGSMQQFAGSPLTNEMSNEADRNFLKTNTRMPQAMQRKASKTQSPLTPKAQMAAMSMGSDSGFGARAIGSTGSHHEKSQSAQWIQTPNSLSSFPGSGFASPPAMHQAGIDGFMMKAGTSMPAKLGANTGALTTQEAKRKRRRESHNLVERRRRDNINERIQDLSKLVPAHRLEDEKIRKAIQNGTPLSPTLAGIGSPSQATSGLAGPGARRATSVTAGNITTGLPIDDKDKGPNKGDILNGAVSWTRDLMWMLHLKIQQQEELVNCIAELGGRVPFEMTDDEQRMQTELMEAVSKAEEGGRKTDLLSYSRTAGSGLRVPHHTDYKGEPVNGSSHIADLSSITPETEGGIVGSTEFDDESYVDFDGRDNEGYLKEEDEYEMDLN